MNKLFGPGGRLAVVSLYTGEIMTRTLQSSEQDEFDGRAAVDFEAQVTRGSIRAVEVDRATVCDHRFVAGVYTSGMELVGTSEQLAAGETFNGEIELDRPLTESQTMTVVLHRAEDGEPGDRVRINGIVVLDNASIRRREQEVEV